MRSSPPIRPRGPNAAELPISPAEPRDPSDRAESLIRSICEFGGVPSFLDDIDEDIRGTGLLEAVKLGRTQPIFDWLLWAFSFQGISDRAAWEYMRKHGTASWHQIEAGLTRRLPCPKLRAFSAYEDCRYEKIRCTCAMPNHIDACPVPLLRLRNGRLNQTAFSFFFFVRDVADGDLVGWIDNQLEAASRSSTADPEMLQQEALIGPLRTIWGVSDKLLTMALSSLLIGARDQRPLWFKTGTTMIAVDTLVHNGPVRSSRGLRYPPSVWRGLLCRGRLRRNHQGNRGPDRCPRLQSKLSKSIPAFCSARDLAILLRGGLNLCNGNRIAATEPCRIDYCHLFRICDRKSLKAL